MIEELKKHPVIPVVVIDDAADAVSLAAAILKGGMNVIEITFRTAAAAGAIEQIKKAFPEMLVGAGTVVTKEQARRALDSGVDFGLAPGLNPETVEIFQAHNTLFIPGIMSPSEIERGLALDLSLLKFFPAEAAGGIKMLKAFSAPYVSSGVKFCPTGGVSLDNMNDYLALDTVFAVGGSWLAPRQSIADKKWDEITANVQQAAMIAGATGQ